MRFSKQCKNNMKILNIIDIPWNSGITSYAFEASKGLRQKGHRVFFAVVKNSEPAKIAKEANFETVEICSRKNPFIVNSVTSLKKLIEKEKIEIVNCHTGKGHLLGYFASLFSRNKFILIRTKSDTLQPKKSFLYKKTKKIIVASEFIRRKYLDIGIEPKNIATVYQGIDVSNYRMQVASNNLQTVGIVGRLDPVKGHMTFLEAASIILKKNPSVKFIVAGKEENIKYNDIKAFVAGLGIEKSVEFSGFVDNVQDFMSKCTVGIIASTGSEAVSRVLLEWMACGKVIIATNVGCIPEILDSEYLVMPNNPQAMADKIINMLTNVREIQEIGKRNRNKIEKNFSFEKFISETENIYYEAIKNTSH